MKKLVILLLTVMLSLSGCGMEELETIGNAQAESLPPARQLMLQLPEEAAAAAWTGEGQTLYLCDGYEVLVQTLCAADPAQALQTVTGMKDLTVMQRKDARGVRWDSVWCSTGEAGDQVGRVAMLTDGRRYYCVSMLTQARKAAALGRIWDSLTKDLHLD